MDSLSTIGLTVVFCIEIASLGFLLLATTAYRQLMKRRAAFFADLRGGAGLTVTAVAPHALFMIYAAVTVIAIVVTSVLALFQPHFL